MEGLTLFAGFDKPWRSAMPMLEAIARRSFVHLARTLLPGEIKSLCVAPAAPAA